MNGNRFLDNARTGNQQVGFQVFAVLVTWLFWGLVGSVPIFLLVMAVGVIDPARATQYFADPMNFELLGLPMTVIFAAIMGQFVIGMFGAWLAETKILKKPFVAILNGFGKFRWKRAFLAFGIWIGFMIVYQGITYLLNPESMEFKVDWQQWLIFFPVAIILVPLQSAFEEIAIRGQLLQALGRMTPWSALLPLLSTSIIFALLHGANTEVAEYGAGFMMLHYFSFGFILGAIALMDEGLELAIGIHAGNNVFSLCLVSYPGASLSTPTLFEQQQMTAEIDYLVMIVFVLLFLAIFFGRKLHAFKAVFYNYSPTSKLYWSPEVAVLESQEEPPEEDEYDPWK